MKNKNGIILLLLVLLTTWSLETEAQKRRRPYGKQRKKISSYSGGRKSYGGGGRGGPANYSTIGFSINAMNYFGDITPTPSRFSTDFKFTRAGFGLTYSKVVHPNAAFRLGFNYGTLRADDSETDPSTFEGLGRYQRNAHFRNTIMELSAGFELNLIPNSGGSNNRFPINPYIFLGVAVFSHNPQALAPETDLSGNPLAEGGTWVDLQPLGTEGQNLDGGTPYSLIQLAIPLGLGVKLRLPGNLDANLEIGFRKLFTDYIDDVSDSYPDLDLVDTQLARALSNRANETTSALTGIARPAEFISDNYSPGGVRGGTTKDVYVITQLRLVYILQKSRGGRKPSRAKFR